MFGPETFVERAGGDVRTQLATAGDFAYVGPDELAAHGRIVVARAHGPGSATLVRLMAVESGRSVLQAAKRGKPDMEAIRACETMSRAVAVFVGRAIRGVRPVTTAAAPGSGRKRLPRPVARWGDAVVTGR